MMVLDLCAGLGGASAAMRDRGWQVVTLDYDPKFNSNIIADVRQWSWSGAHPDLIWASPPCTEFAREFMPWSKTGKLPDMSIVLACKRIIDQANPAWWVIENVKGAVRWFAADLGAPSYVSNPYYLWGKFPDLSHVRVRGRKEHLSSTADAERAKIPYRLSEALAVAIELAIPLGISPEGGAA